MVSAGVAVALVFAAIFTVIAISLSSYMIAGHWRNYTQPLCQTYIVRILLLVPVYSVFSLLALFFHSHHVYFGLLRDWVESFALYCFFVLCINVANGHEALIAALASHPPQKMLTPLCCVVAQPNERFLRWIRRGVLQYVLLKVVLVPPSAICEALGYYNEGVWSLTNMYTYQTFISNTAATVALYCIVQFYTVVKDELRAFDPVLKFVCIKIVVFFCFWQSVLIVLFKGFGWIPEIESMSEEEAAIALQNLLICFEMVIVAILCVQAYPYDGYKETPLIREIELESGKGSVLRSVRSTINPHDVVEDTIRSFTPASFKKKMGIVDPLATPEKAAVTGKPFKPAAVLHGGFMKQVDDIVDNVEKGAGQSASKDEAAVAAAQQKQQAGAGSEAVDSKWVTFQGPDTSTNTDEGELDLVVMEVDTGSAEGSRGDQRTVRDKDNVVAELKATLQQRRR